jgi:hypothetical protein
MSGINPRKNHSSRWEGLPPKFGTTYPEKFSIALDEAISFRGEAKRQPLAKFLHGKHSRTTDALKAEAVLEPDNPGG